jgi:hypothetical protein
VSPFPKVTAVIIGAEGEPRILGDRIWIGYTVAHGIAWAGRISGTTAKEECDDTTPGVFAQVRPTHIIQKPLDAVVLIVAPAVIHCPHLRIAERDLPEYNRPLSRGEKS